MSNPVRKASWAVAASVMMVEALKDQGIARWNYPIRSLHYHAKSKLRSFAQAKKTSSPAATERAVSSKGSRAMMSKLEKSKRSEESLRTVMYLSCWGPN